MWRNNVRYGDSKYKGERFEGKPTTPISYIVSEHSVIIQPSGEADAFQRTTRSRKRKIEDEEEQRKPSTPPPHEERVRADFGHSIFPNEIWHKIFLFLSKKDLLALTLTSKSLRDIANRFLWADPPFKPTKNGIKAEYFEEMMHLPIQKLFTRDLYFKRKNDAAWFAEIFGKMPHLTELEVSSGHWSTNDITMDVLRTIAPYVTKMTLECIRPSEDCTRSEFVQELAKIDFPRLKSVILPSMILRGSFNRMHHNCKKEACAHRVSRYNLDDLQHINHLPITEINLNYLQPEYEIHDQGWCVFDPEYPLPFPQIPFMLQMKSLNTVVVNLYHALTDEDVMTLKDLRDLNGVNLVLKHCRYKETLERLRQ